MKRRWFEIPETGEWVEPEVADLAARGTKWKRSVIYDELRKFSLQLKAKIVPS